MIQYTPHTTPREPGNTHAAEECAEHVTSRGWGEGRGGADQPITTRQRGGDTCSIIFASLYE